jgi:hypothetical protein
MFPDFEFGNQTDIKQLERSLISHEGGLTLTYATCHNSSTRDIATLVMASSAVVYHSRIDVSRVDLGFKHKITES